MYKAKLWDEDKWNIHEGYKSSKYASSSSSDKKEPKLYHEQKYGSSEKSSSSDYMRKEDAKEKDESKKDDLFGEIEEEKKTKEDLKEEDIPFKAAKQIFTEHRNEDKKEAVKKDKNTIEDAIKKAIEEEKKVIMMDN
ncbi:hypothetical protein HY637_05130 [Candidatus Woesearchaeota archaeon]|nr:hypothetical protein [Candidatus Woesearchaeota archaeon]